MQQCFLPQRLFTSLLFHIKSGGSRTHQVPQEPQQSHLDTQNMDRDPSPPSPQAELLLGSIPPAPSHLSSKTQLLLDTGDGFLTEHSVSPKAHEGLFCCWCHSNPPEVPHHIPTCRAPIPVPDCWAEGWSCCLLWQLVAVE